MERIKSYCQKLIEISFYLLFFLVPLVFSPNNYELFEYNKMMLTYAITIFILALWLIKMAINKIVGARRASPVIVRTPLDKFLVFFLISQILSTIFSIDVHVSIFGYYSRFHQGLLATISYTILYFALVSNFPKEKIKNLLYVSFSSALIVSLWGIMEHYGHSLSCLLITNSFTVDCWVQDVQTRVFATLGQPNWMSAYLAILIPIAIGLFIENSRHPERSVSEVEGSSGKSKVYTYSKDSSTRSRLVGMTMLFLSFTLYISFLFTRSRSGFAALWIGLIIFAILLFLKSKKDFKLFIVPLLFIIITFLFGSGISQIDRFTLVGARRASPAPEVAVGPALESGGTESGTIRAIVWKGALDVMLHYPIFGSGVETFAFSYYQYRPQAHNMVSEWDFLYNKAHNEYLNFGATTGLVGFIAYMSFIVAFIFWFIKNIKAKKIGAAEQFSEGIFALALFAGWLTILVTNFFGFSVVVVALYFYLIPAMVFMSEGKTPVFYKKALNNLQSIILTFLTVVLATFLFTRLYNFYQADIDYAKGSSLSKNGKIKEAYLYLSQAIEKNPNEPIYHDEISNTLASIAVAFIGEKDEESAKKFASLALKESDIATTISPNNFSFYKTKTKVNYALSVIDPSFLARALSALNKAEMLAPTDPKIKYNLAIFQSKMNNLPQAIKILESAVALKPNYKDARYALALLYKDNGETDKAVEELNYILQNIDPNDQETKDKLNLYD